MISLASWVDDLLSRRGLARDITLLFTLFFANPQLFVAWQTRVLRALEEIRVDFDVLLPLSRYRKFLEDSCNGASWFACTAVDALVWVNVQLLLLIVSIFAGSWMNAVNGTNIHTRSVFGANTRLGDYVGHSEKSFQDYQSGKNEPFFLLLYNSRLL